MVVLLSFCNRLLKTTVHNCINEILLLSTMVSRKKAAGKARKAKKAAKAEAKEERNNNPTAEKEKESLWRVSESNNPTTFMRGLNQLKCKHGVEPPLLSTDICLRFAFAFGESFDVHCDIDATDGGERLLSRCLIEAQKDTVDEFAEVWNDSAKMQIAMSFFLCDGTEGVLEGDYNHARVCATIVRFFEQYNALVLKQTQALVNWPKIRETRNADLHTLVKFFRHRIPCSCLDEKYDEVKSITKVGNCYNLHCRIPGRSVERSKTMCCSRCRNATYCSRDCQEANWSRHKADCDNFVARIAKFKDKQQNGAC